MKLIKYVAIGAAIYPGFIVLLWIIAFTPSLRSLFETSIRITLTPAAHLTTLIPFSQSSQIAIGISILFSTLLLGAIGGLFTYIIKRTVYKK